MNVKKTGDFIAKCRKDKGMTQKQLADCLGISDKSISKWERGINLPESALFIPLCEFLDIQVQELLTGEHLQKEQLMEESNKLLIDLASEQKKSIMWSEFMLFFIFFPVLLFLISPFISNMMENGGGFLTGIIMLYGPFLTIFGLLKAIECIKNDHNYFGYFLLASLSLFFFTIMTISMM